MPLGAAVASGRGVLDRIANPPVVNPLDLAQNAAKAAGAVYDVRQKQAEQVAGQLATESIDPVTKQFDPAVFNAKVARAGPDVAMAAQTALQNSSTLATDQVNRARYTLGWYQGATGALSDDASRDQIINTIQSGVRAGVMTPTQAQNEIANLPTDQAGLTAYIQQHRQTAMNAKDQFETRYGTIEAQDTPGGVVYVRKPPAGPAGANAPLPYVPKGISDADLNKPVEGGSPDLREKLPDGSPNPNYLRKVPMTLRQQLEGQGYTIGPNNVIIPPRAPPGAPAPGSSSSIFPNNGRLVPKPPAAAPAPAPQGNAAPANTGNEFAGPGAPTTAPQWTQPPAAVPGGAGAFLVRTAGGPSGPTGPAPNALTPPTATVPIVGDPRTVPPTGTSVPAAGPAQPPPGTQPSPGELEWAGGKGPFSEEQKAGTQAVGLKAILSNMRADAGQFVPGTGAEAMKTVGRALQSWWPSLARQVGIDPTKIGAQESFDKLAAQLLQQQMTGPGSDYRMGINVQATPSSTLSKDGVDLILAQLQGNADYIQARARLAAEYPSKSNYGGFSEYVRQNLDPRAFQYENMTAKQGSDWLHSLGANDQQQIMKSYLWAKNKGLFGG